MSERVDPVRAGLGGPPGAAAVAIAGAFEQGAALAMLSGASRMARRACLRRLARRLGARCPVWVLRVRSGGSDHLVDAFAAALGIEASAAGGGSARAGLRAALAAAAGPGGAPLLILDDIERAPIDEAAELALETRDPESGARLLRLALAGTAGGAEARFAELSARIAPERFDFLARLPERLAPMRGSEHEHSAPPVPSAPAESAVGWAPGALGALGAASVAMGAGLALLARAASSG